MKEKGVSSIVVKLIYYIFFISIFLSNANASQVEGEIAGLEFQLFDKNENLYYSESSDHRFFWLKGQFSLDQLGQSLVMQIPSPHLQDMELYVYREGKLISISDANKDSEGKSFVRYNQFQFDTDSTQFYIKSKNSMFEGLEIIVAPKDTFYQQESTKLLRIGLYYGLGLMSIIFNLVFFLIFKDRRFIAYSLLQVGVFVEFFYEDGMFHYLSSGRLVLENLLVYMVPFTATLACVFAYYFLDLKHAFKSYWKYIAPVIALAFIGLILFLIFEWGGFVALINISSLSAASIAIGIAVRQFKKDVYARFLVLTFGVIVLFGVGFVLNQNFNQAWLSFFDMDTFRLVSAFEIISISFAIIFKARSLQAENEQYRLEINRYLYQLKELTTTQPKEVKPTDPDRNIIETLKSNYQLTERETDVLLGIWEGLSNQSLADKLFISLNTVKYHVSNLYLKLEVKNRTQAVKIKDKIAL
ncbi:LuxR C-terminal-related transcriptional regulator [Sphingobacterium sp. SYP-B4668]|uniref:LuxR C-terminal-related transcriptional regulator n=1 Tax=Sphingobacterium sp. SYP-B4668 TaxID=2996035 RepID=UPI0022DD9A14|nr:LuxR C-terminal-related transcriptional regulator [Sphingobacterium sp. SYP-B4668]